MVWSFMVSATSDEFWAEPKRSSLLGSSRRGKIAFRAGMRTLVALVSNDSANGCPSPGTAFEPSAMFADFKTYSNQQWVASTDQPIHLAKLMSLMRKNGAKHLEMQMSASPSCCEPMMGH
jgi:hypothetical protein